MARWNSCSSERGERRRHAPAAQAAVAGRGHFALHTARVAGPGRINFQSSASALSNSSILCHPERSVTSEAQSRALESLPGAKSKGTLRFFFEIHSANLL